MTKQLYIVLSLSMTMMACEIKPPVFKSVQKTQSATQPVQETSLSPQKARATTQPSLRIIKVEEEFGDIRLTKYGQSETIEELELLPGKTFQLSGSVYLDNGNVNSHLQWDSEDQSIVIVNSEGLVRAKKIGSATIKASYIRNSQIQKRILVKVVEKLTPLPTPTPKSSHKPRNDNPVVKRVNSAMTSKSSASPTPETEKPLDKTINLIGEVKNERGNLIEGAIVTARVLHDDKLSKKTSTVAGIFSFQDLPTHLPIEVTIELEGNQYEILKRVETLKSNPYGDPELNRFKYFLRLFNSPIPTPKPSIEATPFPESTPTPVQSFNPIPTPSPLVAKLTGQVIDSDTQQPLVGVSIQLIGTGKIVSTNAQGHYEFPQLSPGVYTLKASLNGYSYSSIHVQIKDNDVAPNLQLNPIHWQPVITGTSNTLKDIFFVNTQNGWAVGKNGTILVTYDGGQSWTQQTSGVYSHLNAVHFVNANIGWIAANNGFVLKTTDGGINWIKKDIVTSIYDYLTDIKFINSQVGYVTGDDAVYKTINGGETWNRISTYNLGNYFDFFNESIGYASYGHTTINGGQSWQYIGNQKPFMSDVQYLTQNVLYAIGSKFYKSINSGLTWSTVASTFDDETNLAFKHLHFLDTQNGYLVSSNGTNKLFKTTDGGVNWKKVDISSGSYYLTQVFFLDASHGWAIGNQGVILRY